MSVLKQQVKRHFPNPLTRMKWALLAVLPQHVRRYYAHWRTFREWPNLRQPQLFSEKLAWRYLYDRRSVLSNTCDKLWSKEYASKRAAHLGLNVPRTRWWGSDLSELLQEVRSIPASLNWVLKPNHLSGGRVMFGEGALADLQEVKDFVVWCRSDEFRLKTTGWAYANARSMFIIEDRINRPDENLPDYKLHVFDGTVACIQVVSGRWSNPRKSLYSPDWALLDSDKDGDDARPVLLPQMRAFAEAIAKGFDYMRVDLYIYNDAVWFGELTPYPSFVNIVRDRSLNEWLGSLWTLPGGAMNV